MVFGNGRLPENELAGIDTGTSEPMGILVSNQMFEKGDIPVVIDFDLEYVVFGLVIRPEKAH